MSGECLHATAVAIGGDGVLLRGPSGSGKSDLALRLIDRGAKLVSDDAVMIDIGEGRPFVRPAPNIEGRIEVRGIGICPVETVTAAPLRLVVDLVDAAERMPPNDMMTAISGFDVPLVKIVPFEASAPIKVEIALRSVVDAACWPVPLQNVAKSESSPS
ncbi:MAG TPA: HPr kinase/phosphatase C-terminal domain-containing protein [Sphingorhabdus sp.]|jgi:serine kinase of HPr protein (carbohydrate metabolism regulator)|nr:HPr kinase/phosphatase C-terminal domain-containing protein [Sphingorhabdus sp.]